MFTLRIPLLSLTLVLVLHSGSTAAVEPEASGQELPQVLLIGGHSVSNSFPIVHLMLQGTADVHIATNGSNNTTRSMENMEQWLENEDWDLIYFNRGLEDIRHNRLRTTPEEFEANVRSLVAQMLTSGAKLVFSTTPTVAKENRQRVSQAAINTYNDIALEIMSSEDITVFDLAAIVASDIDSMLNSTGITLSAAGDLAVGESAALAIAHSLGQDISERRKAELPPATKHVLIIGDSISWGYFKTVTYVLHGDAIVMHAEGNNQGTTHGLKEMDNWLAAGEWDVIHFNFGLHDLKHVDENGRNAHDRSAAQQADVETYERNLRVLVDKLKATGAKLIFATTTPVPHDHGPLRDLGESKKYNQAALGVMREHDIAVNDLYNAVMPDLAKYQNRADVHFHPAGSVFLGKLVAEEIRRALK